MITEELIAKSEGLIKLSREVRDEGKGYLMYDDGAVEVEVAEFLWGLTRLLKPQRVLTTGIYTGISDMYIAQGLKDNGFGRITALEIESKHLARASTLWVKTEVAGRIDGYLIKSLDYQPYDKYQLMFLDSEPQIRWAELVKYYPYLDEGGYVLIHDVPLSLGQGNINPDHPEFKSWPWGDLPEEIKNWVKDGELRPFHFPNPRGMIGFYKTRNNEYKWL